LNIVDRIPIETGEGIEELELGQELPNDSPNDSVDWDMESILKSIPASKSNVAESGKRQSVFFVEWADKPNA